MANPQEDALQYVFDKPEGQTLPEPGRSIEVAPGVRWLRMPLPFALDHINLWLLRDAMDGIEGWTIVDCGVANDTTRALWQQVFQNELQGLPVLRVIVTHMHPDHIGLAHWLCQHWTTPERECRMWISATDWNAARVASQATTGFGGEHAARFFALHGLDDPAALDKVRGRGSYYANMVPDVPRSFVRLLDGRTVHIGARHWRCIAGYGHAPEHMALFSAGADAAAAEPARPSSSVTTKGSTAAAKDRLPGVLIAGDMVLPRISTNVSVIDIEPQGDPLPLYLESIARLRSLPADTLVLPSHGKPFIGLHQRIGQLHAHHDERFAEVLQACSEAPRSAADMLPVLFKRSLDLHQTTFAMGEAVAHMHALAGRRLLSSVRGSDGVQRWKSTA